MLVYIQGLVISVLVGILEKCFQFWKAEDVQDIWSGNTSHSAEPEPFVAGTFWQRLFLSFHKMIMNTLNYRLKRRTNKIKRSKSDDPKNVRPVVGRRIKQKSIEEELVETGLVRILLSYSKEQIILRGST